MSKPAILIVEDEAIVAMDLAMKLDALGYEVVRTVSTGEAALAVAEQQHPDLILLDLKLAGALEGIETAQQLKRYDIPVVFLTGNSDRETLNRVHALEPAGYILKPFGERDLAIQIDITLYKAHANRALREKEEQLRRSHEELAQEAAALTRLTELSSRLWRQRTLQEGLEEMLAATVELVGADKGNIQLTTDDKVLMIATQQGFDEEFLTFFKEVSIQDNSACGRALRSGNRIIIEDVECDPDYADLRVIARNAGYRAVQSTPLIGTNGQPLGMLSTHWRSVHRPGRTELHRLDLYARQAADFIERVKADDAVRKTEQAAQDVALFPAQNPSPVLRVGKEGHLLYMNPASSQLLAALGLHIGQPIPGVLCDCVRSSFETAQSETIEYDVEPRHYLVTITPISERDYANLYWTDITTHKQAEQSLRESEERFRTLADNMSQFAWMIDQAGNAVWFNRRWYDYTGTTLEHMRGWGWRKVHHPDHEERVVASWRRAFARETPWEETFPLRSAEGQYRWFLTRAIPIRDSQGTVIRWFGTNTDITESREAEEALRKSEERLRLANLATNEAIWDWDVASDTVIWNENVATLFGWSEAAESPQTAAWWVERLHPEDRPRVTDHFFAAVNDAAAVFWSDEYRFQKSDGGYAYVLDRAYAIRDKAGTPLRMLGTMLDITDRKRTEEALRESEERLRAVVETAVDGIMTIDEQGIIESANPAVERIFQHSVAELIGRNIKVLMPEPHQQEHDDYLRRYRDTGEKKIIGIGREVMGRRKDGSLFPVELSISESRLPGRRFFTGILRDITARKQAEAALRDSEAQFHQIANGLPQIVWTARPDGYIDYYNERWYEYTGFRRGEFGQTSWEPILHPDDVDHCVQTYYGCIRAGIPYQIEYRFKDRSSGGYRWFMGRALPIRDEHGNITRWFGTCTDIDHVKRMSEALRESEARLRLAQSVTQAGVFDWNVHTNEVSWTPELEALYGLSPGEFGRTYQDFRERIHPEDLARIELERDQALTKQRRWQDLEFRIVLPSGEVRWIDSVGGGVYDESGSLVRVLGINKDVTQRKRSEEALRDSESRFRELVERSPFGIYIVDSQFRIVHMNEAGQRGAFRNVRPVIGRNFAEAMRILWPEPVAADVIRVFRHTLDMGEPYSSRDFINTRADVELTEAYEWELHQIRLSDGQPGVICYYYDSTKLRQAETALRAAQERLEQWSFELERAVTAKTAELLSSEHRLRALTRELNLAEQRERKRLATEMHDHLQQLLVLGKMQIGQGKRLALGMPACESVMRRVDDILSDALTYTRTLVAELSPPVLRDHGLAAGLKWLGEYMQKHNLTVTVTVSDGAEVDLPEDQVVLLFQSVRELLMNSWKHAGTGCASIVMDRRDGQLVVQVTDEGKGFDLAAAAATPNGGLSSKFGLFSIRERMRAMGGSLQVQSELNQGTCVTLILPLETAPLAQEVPQEEVRRLSGSRAAPIGDGRREKGVRVVLVDDHAMVRQGLRSILTGYSNMEIVGEAANGVEALCAVEQHRPTVVIMDINMPRMDGIEATARIKARYPEIFVIGLSVNAGSENQQAMQNAGAAALLTKEAVVEQLYGAIQEAVNGRCEGNDMSASNQARV